MAIDLSQKLCNVAVINNSNKKKYFELVDDEYAGHIVYRKQQRSCLAPTFCA